jgi:HlyD family secretion protein
MPDRVFTGTVTEIGNSPIQATAAAATQRTATNFKVTITLDDQIPDVRPGFTCTAEISTASRTAALSVPIQALTVRELLYGADGRVIPETRPPQTGFRFGRPPATPSAPVVSTELQPGQKRQETEGVFLIRDGKATFVAVKLGIAGERYLEVLNGLAEGDRVITGPFESVRGLYEGDAVTTAPAPGQADGSRGVTVRVGS